MVSLWPWKGADDTASFEKTLSSLSTRITKANVKQDNLRARSRRYRVIWTLYTTLAYLLATLILVLVTGWENWGPVEFTVVAAGPLAIYLVRWLLTSFYDYRISSNQAYLDDLQAQRETAIEKFKAATKYNTTQQLLEKYGAAPKSTSTPNDSPSSGKKRKSTSQSTGVKAEQREQRTNLPPPPTANIRPPAERIPAYSTPGQTEPRFVHSTPSEQGIPHQQIDRMTSQSRTVLGPPSPDASFAPNAYDSAPQYSDSASNQPQWYDRILELLIGEDETRPINRLALICEKCKLVNGQAPPGVKRLEEVGRWRCGGCGEWNGRENEAKRIVREIGKSQAPLERQGAEQQDPENEEEEFFAVDDISAAKDEGIHAEDMEMGRSDEDVDDDQTPELLTRLPQD